MKPHETAKDADIQREYDFLSGKRDEGRERYVGRGDKVTPCIECHEFYGVEGTVRMGPPIGGRGPMLQVVWENGEVKWHWPSELKRLGRA